MELQLLPDPGDPVADVLRQAVQDAGVPVGDLPVAYRSAWRHAALGEAAHHSDPVADTVADGGFERRAHLPRG